MNELKSVAHHAQIFKIYISATVITSYYSSLLNVQILTLYFVRFLKEVRVRKNALGYFLNFFFATPIMFQ